MLDIASLAEPKHAGFNLLFLILAALMLSACGGTKIYNNDKTIVYNNSIYNVSSVKQISTSTTAKLGDDSTVDLQGADKKKVQSLLEANGPIFVTMKFNLDNHDMVYRANSVSTYSEYSRMK